jgi:8-oxo-dGTP diphosphatase
VQVAAGILRDANGRVLITDRTRAKTMRDLWEFPGGKLLPGESAEAALARELHEELGITINSYEQFHCLEHDYPDISVAVDFYLINDWSGEPSGVEGQGLRWETVDNISAECLLPADIVVLEALQTCLR